MKGSTLSLARAVSLSLMMTATAAAQDGEQVQPPPDTTPAWQWTLGANAFFGYNYQLREFRDFSAWESQNWLMAGGERRSGNGTLRVTSMLSFEPFTLRDIGSPQVFQTGETFQGAPLIDYQHPHDLIMAAGAEYRRVHGRFTLIGGLDLVGSPTIGPPVFMHRPSAADNPQAPLSHHHMDSTHITPGVLRLGVDRAGWRAEGSWFRGREPDENRLDLDLGAFDSYAGRLSWTGRGWAAQVSAAHRRQPEAFVPFNTSLRSASISYARPGVARPIAWLAAFGQNREYHGNSDAYLLEASMPIGQSHAVYGRAELVEKFILNIGFHPGTFHLHQKSPVGALTLGYVKDLVDTRVGSFGIGGDVTGYAVPDNLRVSYGSPASFHVFMRYRRAPRSAGEHVHVH